MLIVGERITIIGDWDTRPVPKNRVPVVLTPSRTWGYGWHAPTRASLEALERHVRPGMSVLDVGTGSGILAIAAARLGASRVWGTDIHPDALRLARQHVEMNGVDVEISDSPLAGDGLDLIVANIGMPPFFAEHLPAILKRLVPGGLFIPVISTEAVEMLGHSKLEPIEHEVVDEQLSLLVLRRRP